jgi:serine/threonine protein kinase
LSENKKIFVTEKINAMPPKVTLTITKGSLSGETISFDQKESLILGRLKDCHIVFSDSTVSRHHCLLEIDPPSVTVKDLGSTRGTSLNGKRVNRESSLKTGDCLKLGPYCEIMLDIEQPVAEESTKPKKRPGDILKERMNGYNNGAGIYDNVVKIPGYRTIREIGRGGMGVVWLVEEVRTGEQMALKVMLPREAADEKCRKMFLREASLSGQLDHKNVVRQNKYGQSGGTSYILMEYCPGGSIETLMIKKDSILDLDLANHIILQALDGLDYCHHAKVIATLEDGTKIPVTGVVHRDFKPGNILLSDHSSCPDVKIADFGLAKTFNTAGLSGVTTNKELVGGMLEFMCSDQAHNFRYAKPKVDVWAAAACYYYMLTGVYPKNFRGGKAPLHVVLNDPAVPIREHNKNIPKKVADIIDAVLIERLEKPKKVTKTAFIRKLTSNKKPDNGISALELKTAIIESIS